VDRIRSLLARACIGLLQQFVFPSRRLSQLTTPKFDPHTGCIEFLLTMADDGTVPEWPNSDRRVIGRRAMHLLSSADGAFGMFVNGTGRRTGRARNIAEPQSKASLALAPRYRWRTGLCTSNFCLQAGEVGTD
jgi:hypothetical protein